MKYIQQTKEAGSTAKIPDEAAKMYQENEKFVNYVTNLDYTTKSYNKIRTTVLDVEKPLVQKQLSEIDQKLKRAEKELSWSTPGKNPSLHLFFFFGEKNTHISKIDRISNEHSLSIELLVVESAFYKGLFFFPYRICMIVSFVSSSLFSRAIR